MKGAAAALVAMATIMLPAGSAVASTGRFVVELEDDRTTFEASVEPDRLAPGAPFTVTVRRSYEIVPDDCGRASELDEDTTGTGLGLFSPERRPTHSHPVLGPHLELSAPAVARYAPVVRRLPDCMELVTEEAGLTFTVPPVDALRAAGVGNGALLVLPTFMIYRGAVDGELPTIELVDVPPLPGPLPNPMRFEGAAPVDGGPQRWGARWWAAVGALAAAAVALVPRRRRRWRWRAVLWPLALALAGVAALDVALDVTGPSTWAGLAAAALALVPGRRRPSNLRQ